MTASNRPAVRVVLPGGRPPRRRDRVLSLGRLRRRRNDTPEIQRARIIDAFVREVGDRGLAGTEIPAACRRAEVSLFTFYELFPTKSACTLAAFTLGSEIVCDVGEAAFDETVGPWEVRLRAAISTMLDLLASSPGFARLAVVDMRRDANGVEHFNTIVARCRNAFGGPAALETPAGVDVDVAAYESVLVGAALGELDRAVRDGRVAHLPELAATVTLALALPVVGPDRAYRQL
jgi:AcrR family transcriptional regulator